MEPIAIVLTLGALALFAWLIYSVRALRGDVRDLAALFRGAHNGYSDPSAAAVVTSSPAPEPAPARVALPAAPASAAAPSTVPMASKVRVADVRPWPLPFQPTAEQVAAARAAHAGADEVEGDERKTVQIPAARVVQPAPPNVAQALGARGTMLGLGVEPEKPSDDAGDRETDEGKTQVWSADETTPTAVSPTAMPEVSPEHDVGADLSEAVLARVDALARDQGMTRGEFLLKLARLGLPAEERRKADLDKGKKNGKA
jgi:hypothetical protein